MDRELLAQHGKGIIGTTGCPSGEVQVHLRHGQYDAARQAAADYQDIFGKDNYFLELMDHGLDIETRVRDGLLRLAKDLQIPLLATNDSHYVNQEDATQPGAPALHQLRLDDGHPGRRRSRAAVRLHRRRLLPQVRRTRCARCGRQYDLREACDNTLLIAERCDVAFTEGNGTYMPRFPCPTGETEDSWLVKEVETGLRSATRTASPPRSASRPSSRSASSSDGLPRLLPGGRRLHQLGQGQRHPGRPRPRLRRRARWSPTRMRITDLDPLEHGLLFERFLNPDRISMPDFDIDFDERRRGEVIRYVTEKYGEDRVSMIVTYGTIKAKQAVKDSSRILGYPFAMGDRITKAMPAAVMGKDDPAHRRSSTPSTSATARAASSAASTTTTPTSSGSSTPPSASRASSASGACTPPA